jgi:hypothetical protein
MQAVNAVASRQRTDVLWESSTLLASGGTFTGAVRLVAGYGGVNVFISSNLSFRLRFEEACSEDGPWTETDRETSTLNEEGTRQVICRRLVPCGAYARIRVDNLGGALMTAFSLCLLGLPVGDSTTATLVGPGGVAADVRNADACADFAASLNGWLTNSRMAVFDRVLNDWCSLYGDLPSAVNGATASSVRAAYANAIAVGLDSTGVSVMRPVEARDFNANADVGSTLIGLLTNSRNAYFDLNDSNWARWEGDVAANISGRGTSTVRSPYTASIVVGFDNTGAAVLRPVEARDFTIPSDVGSTLIGLLVNSRNSFIDDRTTEWNWIGGTSYASVAGNTNLEICPGPFVYQPRESAFVASRRGRRFYSTHQTPNTVITAQASFVATTPTFMLRQAATAVRVILRSITLFIVNTPTDDVRVTVEIDTADRFSAGGTSHTPQNVNEESATASGITSFLSNPTATAAGAGTRYLVNALVDNTAPSRLSIDFKDGVLLSTTASLLTYVFGNGGATPADVFFVFEWEEVA